MSLLFIWDVVFFCYMFLSLCVCVCGGLLFFARGAAEEEEQLRRVGFSTASVCTFLGFSGVSVLLVGQGINIRFCPGAAVSMCFPGFPWMPSVCRRIQRRPSLVRSRPWFRLRYCFIVHSGAVWCGCFVLILDAGRLVCFCIILGCRCRWRRSFDSGRDGERGGEREREIERESQWLPRCRSKWMLRLAASATGKRQRERGERERERQGEGVRERER